MKLRKLIIENYKSFQFPTEISMNRKETAHSNEEGEEFLMEQVVEKWRKINGTDQNRVVKEYLTTV